MRFKRRSLLALVAVVGSGLLGTGCMRLQRVVLERVIRAAQQAGGGAGFTSLDDLKADVKKPPGAAEILIAQFVPADAKDQDLAVFSAAYSEDLGLRVTRLPQVRGQVPAWVVEEAMRQHGIATLALDSETAIKLARLAGRRHALVGTIERKGDRLHISAQVYDAKEGAKVGEAIEISGTPQELFDREGWFATQVAQRIGIKLSAADREWLGRRQFRRLENLLAMFRPVAAGENYAQRIAAIRAREPDSLLVETRWLRWGEFRDKQAYLAALQAAHRRFPQDPTILRWLFEAYLNRADRTRARAALDEFTKLHPGSWEGCNVRARYHRYLERDREASLRAVESMAVLYPDCWMSWLRCASEASGLAHAARAGHFFGEMNRQQQRTFVRGMREGLAAAERGSRLNDRDVALWVELIHLYRETGTPEQAERAFKHAIALDPGCIHAYDALAWVYAPGYENDPSRRTKVWREALAAPAKTWGALQVQAEIAVALKEMDKAQQLFERALEVAGNAACPSLHLSYADVLADKFGRYAEAEKHARIALEQQVSADGYLALAEFLLKQKRLEEAMQAAKQAQRLAPDDPDCDQMIAAINYDMGKVNQALAGLEKAHRREPRHVEYLDSMLDAYLEQGDYDKAWEVMQEIKRHPKWEEGGIELLNVADIHALKGHYREAIRYYDLNLKKKPGHVKSLTRGALCYMVMGDFAHAAPRWQQVLDKHPDHAESHMGLALCLINLGQEQKAYAEARQAVALNHNIANPRWLHENCYWPEEGAAAAAELAAAAQGR